MTSTPLTIAWSSLGERIDQITLPSTQDIEKILCLQAPGDHTPDIGMDKVVIVPGRGVARSRNAAIASASRQYLLFCDDDVQVNLPGVLAGVRHLQRTGHALALGRARDTQGQLRKNYGCGRPRALSLLNSGKAATYEMLLDVTQVRAAGVAFDERFGAGTVNYLGDEYIFIADLLRAGLRGSTVPHVFGTHPLHSSGSIWSTSSLGPRAAAINRVFGPLSLPARAVFAVRHRSRITSPIAMLNFLLDGQRPCDQNIAATR